MNKWYHQFQDLFFKYYFVKYCSVWLYVSAVFGIECHSTPNFVCFLALFSQKIQILNDCVFCLILIRGSLLPLPRKRKVSDRTVCIFFLVIFTDPKKSSKQCAVAATFPGCRRTQYSAVCSKLGSFPKPNHLFSCCPQRRTCEEGAIG